SIDGELLAVVAADDALLGENRDLADGRVARAAEGSAGGDPAADLLVFIGRDVKAFAAAMGDGAAGLQEEQAMFRRGGKEPPATVFLDQRLVIEFGDEAEEREGETVLPARLAVATARVAAELGEDRHDVVG